MKRKLPADEIVAEMYRSGMACPEIAEQLGVTASTVRKRLVLISEPRRSISDAVKLTYARGRTVPKPSYWKGKKQPAEMVEHRVSKIRGPNHYLWNTAGKIRRQTVASTEWLYQKYVVEELGTYEIAKLVNRNAKRVYEWLKQDGIPLRTKHDSIVAMNKRSDTIEKRRVSSANRVITEEQKRKLSATRTGKHYPNLQGAGNGMFGRRGDKHHGWKGGLTPERQALYSSPEWSKVVSSVWKRDDATCQKCGCRKTKDKTFDIHHIVSFTIKELRTELTNLVLLCRGCHKFVHSRKNVSREFLRDNPE